MKDQHKKITGYRDLSQNEINLINEVKAHDEKTQELINRVLCMRAENKEEVTKIQMCESGRCFTLAKTNLQQGSMWLTRGIALSNSF